MFVMMSWVSFFVPPVTDDDDNADAEVDDVDDDGADDDNDDNADGNADVKENWWFQSALLSNIKHST